MKPTNPALRIAEINDEASERNPLLPRDDENITNWQHPKEFFWIELALMCNVFLAGFDGTIAASTYATIGSSFGAAHLASWITTSYQLTSTAAQPLYGRFSDIFGRKICLLLATAMFGLGCLGSSVSNDMLMLCLTRALTGIGGGGLITMSTIINSDLVPPKQRGMYQAVQNIMMGFGMTSGACLGGSIADSVGWRFGFLLQVPIAAGGFAVACTMVHNINYQSQAEPSKQSQWKQVDFAGSFTLVSGLTLLTAALSLGSMDLSLRSPSTLVCFIGSVIFLFAFVRVEASTSAKAIMPLFMFQRLDRAILLVSNIGLGFTVNGLLFLMPLVFQTVLLDSPSTAGFRLLPPSMMAPIGGIATGYIMTRGDYLLSLSRLGQILFLFSVTLLLTLDFDAEGWKYSASMLPSSFGQGAMYPAGLFAFIRTVEKPEHAVATGTVYLTRSVGGICGIAAVSTVTQTILVSKLNIALRGLSNGNEIIEQLRRSVDVISDLPMEIQEIARYAYGQACRTALWMLFTVSASTVVLCFMIRHPTRYVKAANS